MANEFTARVAGISVELGMSVQNKSGIWCKPTVKMDLKIDGGTNPQQREAIIKQAFDEVCDNIEKTISEIQYCRGKNYTPKVTTVEKFASTLRDNAGEDPVVALAIVDQSIDKGWKDLYPLKNYGRQGKPTAVSKKFSGNTLKDAEGKDIVFK